ncbi:hypothetical protein K6W21_07145 [Burkholderia latens]|uniref:hypothetical protein n=1 Tax=Burkholderia latens TaxID=488446 RepID=UPI001C960BA6|nr:hypothetical protein [Burkholderia latens]MBY4693867.1 hypothetical protein [Burkholderia latens]
MSSIAAQCAGHGEAARACRFFFACLPPIAIGHLPSATFGVVRRTAPARTGSSMIARTLRALRPRIRRDSGAQAARGQAGQATTAR